jgi:hypothetical protein
VTRAVTKTWYRIALARKNGEPALVAAQGEHLGAAIAAAEAHVSGSHAFAVEVANGDVPLGESVGKHHIVELGAATDTPSLHWPTGILPAIGHTAALASARRGWVEHADPKLFVVEAQTDADHLVDLFLGMIEKLPAADNLEVRLLDHFEDAGATEVWLTSRVNAKKILGFLDDFDDDLIHNGHIELSIYVREHKATLRLTEHKTVVWIADDRALETDVTGWLRGLEVPKAESITRVVSVPHFHYRLAKSRDRKALAKELFRQRLRRVDTVRVAATGPREPD